MILKKNTVGKGEIARDEQFLLFPTVFSTLFENFPPFSSNLKLSSANSFCLEESKICCFKGLKDIFFFSCQIKDLLLTEAFIGCAGFFSDLLGFPLLGVLVDLGFFEASFFPFFFFEPPKSLSLSFTLKSSSLSSEMSLSSSLSTSKSLSTNSKQRYKGTK